MSSTYKELADSKSPRKGQARIQISFWNKITFSHLDGLLYLGSQRPIQLEDLPELDEDDSSFNSSVLLLSNWHSELMQQSPSLTRALINAYGRDFLIGNLFKFPQDCLIFVGPVALRRIVSFIDPSSTPDEEVSIWNGLFLVAVLFCSQLLQSIFLHQYFSRVFRVAMRTRCGLTSIVYQKALQLSCASRQDDDFSTGAIVNLMQVDCQKLMDFIPYASNLLWSSPFQILVAMSMLYSLVGTAAFAGLAAMLFVMPANAWAMRRLGSVQERNMACKDERLRTVTELLGGMRVVKLFGWAGPSLERVERARAAEVGALWRYGVLSGLQGVFWSATPVAVALTVLGTFVATGGELTLAVAFPVLSLIGILQFPLEVPPAPRLRGP